MDQGLGSQNMSPQDSLRTHAADHDGTGISTPNMDDTSATRDFAVTNIVASMDEPSRHQLNERTKLLENYSHGPHCGNEHCDHGTFSPRPPTHASVASFEGKYSFGGRHDGAGESSSNTNETFGEAVRNRLFGRGNNRMSTTQYLARTHGIANPRAMYVDICSSSCTSHMPYPVPIVVSANGCTFPSRYLGYYFPFVNWIRQYKWAYLKGDIIAALTMASFYIPMSLSYASNLGHIPPINGLYSFVVNPLIYAFLGTCPQMVVGPEAAGSLLVGSVVQNSIDIGHSGDEDDMMNARIAGVVTGMAGAVIFIAGLTRLGYLDSVLSRPFLRGFISAIGFVILVDQLIPEMGLSRRAKVVGGVVHGSSIDKLVFLIENVGYAHKLTCGVAFGSFAIIMVCRFVYNHFTQNLPLVCNALVV